MSKKQQQEQPKKVYVTKVPVQLHVAVSANDLEDARNEVLHFVAAINHTNKGHFSVLSAPVMEEFKMKEANKAPPEVEVEVPADAE